MPPPRSLVIIEMEYKNRKYPRLKQYNYSLPGYYYVTIHNERTAPLLSKVESGDSRYQATVRLTRAGIIAMEQMMLLEQRYPYVRIDKYVIMPTHVHVIIRLLDGAMPRTEIVGAYKSFVTRGINAVRNMPGQRQFQRSFYETVIRSEVAYQSCWRYIDSNPEKWGIQEECEWDFRIVDEDEQKIL